MPTTTTPDRLRAWMSRAGLSQQELATQLGVGQTFVSHLVQGTRTPSLTLAARLQRVTGIPAADWISHDEATA